MAIKRTYKRGKVAAAQPRPTGAGLFQCPKGHPLPHRILGRGRCTLEECCVQALGAHGAMRKALQKENREAQGFAEETEHLLDQKGRMAAWDAIHPLPKITAPVAQKPGESVHAYLRARAAQAAPLALERVIRKMLLQPGTSGDAAADNILDRVGFSRKTEATIENNGPVFIVNFDPSRIPLLSQQAQVQAGTTVEGELVSTTQTGESDDQPVHGDAETRNQMGDPERDD
jgi:hypothetical protein